MTASTLPEVFARVELLYMMASTLPEVFAWVDWLYMMASTLPEVFARVERLYMMASIVQEHCCVNHIDVRSVASTRHLISLDVNPLTRYMPS